MDTRFNPFTGKLGFKDGNTGLASFIFSLTEVDPAVDPGPGKLSLNAVGAPGFEEYQLVLNKTDLRGFYVGLLVSFIQFFMGAYDFWAYVHSKRDPAYWIGGIIYEIETITDEEERETAFILYWFPFLGTTTYVEETDDYISEVIPDGDEVIISMDFAAPILMGGGA